MNRLPADKTHATAQQPSPARSPYPPGHPDRERDQEIERGVHTSATGVRSTSLLARAFCTSTAKSLVGEKAKLPRRWSLVQSAQEYCCFTQDKSRAGTYNMTMLVNPEDVVLATTSVESPTVIMQEPVVAAAGPVGAAVDGATTEGERGGSTGSNNPKEELATNSAAVENSAEEERDQQQKQEEETPQPQSPQMKAPHISTLYDKQDVMVKHFGVTQEQALRTQALLRLGVTDEDVRIAERLMGSRSEAENVCVIQFNRISFFCFCSSHSPGVRIIILQETQKCNSDVFASYILFTYK